MDNERLILMLDALRLEIRNLGLQYTTAAALGRGRLSNELIQDAAQESEALRQRSDNAANTALGQ